MHAVDIPDELDRRLAELARKAGRSKADVVRRALQEWLEDYEDALIVKERLAKQNPRISLDELERELGLAD
jgi:predicted DNA-binding protein